MAALLCVGMLFTMACGILNNLTGSAANNVSSLWSDVPPLEGATKSDTDLPPAAKLAVQAIFQGRLEVASYATNKTPEDVKNFYTTERMKAAGWNADTGGCNAASVATNTIQGAFCVFGKNENGKDLGLAIIATQDDKTKPTNIYYVRIDVSSTPTPAP
jgi:hypothetical protein